MYMRTTMNYLLPKLLDIIAGEDTIYMLVTVKHIVRSAMAW